VLPVLQDAAELEPREKEPPPETLEANVEIFFWIFGLPQAGQFTSLAALALRKSSSNGRLHSVQINSNSGILFSWRPRRIIDIPSIGCKAAAKVTSQSPLNSTTGILWAVSTGRALPLA